MRLVDADKVKREYPWKDDVQYAMRNAPTVKAIPIEWIKHYIKEHSMYGAIDDVFVILHTMLCDWEKENGEITD